MVRRRLRPAGVGVSDKGNKWVLGVGAGSVGHICGVGCAAGAVALSSLSHGVAAARGVWRDGGQRTRI